MEFANSIRIVEGVEGFLRLHPRVIRRTLQIVYWWLFIA